MVQTSLDIHETYRGVHLLHNPGGKLLSMIEFGRSEPKRIAKPLKELAQQKGCGKLEVMVPATQSSGYAQEGFLREARIGGFFGGREDCLLMSLFLEEERSHALNQADRDRILNRATEGPARSPAAGTETATFAASRPGSGGHQGHASHHALSPCTDFVELAAFYVRAMEGEGIGRGDEAYYESLGSDRGVRFMVARVDGRIVSAVSLETFPLHRAARIGNCAVEPEFRRQGYALCSIKAMEEICKAEDICTLYGVARASSEGMNLAFGHQHYRYGGTLVNHSITDLAMEDANIWYKSLVRP